MRFRVEYIAQKERPAYLFARQIDSGEFSVSERSLLGGVSIKPQVSCPRVLTHDGKPDLTVFTFTLATASDLTKLSVGQVVELEAGDA